MTAAVLDIMTGAADTGLTDDECDLDVQVVISETATPRSTARPASAAATPAPTVPAPAFPRSRTPPDSSLSAGADSHAWLSPRRCL